MNRRDFFRAAAGAAAGIIVGEQLQELLLPRTTIFLPPAGGWPPLSNLHAQQLNRLAYEIMGRAADRMAWLLNQTRTDTYTDDGMVSDYDKTLFPQYRSILLAEPQLITPASVHDEALAKAHLEACERYVSAAQLTYHASGHEIDVLRRKASWLCDS